MNGVIVVSASRRPAAFLRGAAGVRARPAARAFYTAVANAPVERIDGVDVERWFATATGAAIGCAMQSAPDRQLVIEGSDVLAATAFVPAFVATGRPLIGLIGEEPACAAFIAALAELSAARYERQARLRHHRLTAVSAVRPASGAMRAARDDDVAWIIAETLAFLVEVKLPDPPSRIQDYVHRRHAGGRYRIWEDAGERVALAGMSDAGDAGARIGPVWTPPAHRGRGYATSLVAALSSEILTRGTREIFLTTDLANPTSNAIYARVGFVPLGDYGEYRRVDG